MRKILFAATFALAPVTAFAAGPIYGPLQAQNALSELGANAAQARLNLGLGSAATHPATDFDAAGTAAGAAAAAQAASVPTTAVGSTVAPLSSGVVPTSNLPAAASGAAGIISLTTAGAQAPVQSVAGLTGAPTASTLSTALTGTAAGTLAAGNDSRITGALQSSAAGPLATQAGANPAAAIAGAGGVVAAGGDAGSTVTTAAGSTTTRTLDNRAADVINVKDFGAVCDGATDDSAAINAALTAARTVNSIANQPAIVVFPSASRCHFVSTLNFTGLQTRGNIIRDNGAVLDCAVVGGACLDGLGTRYLKWEDVTLQATNSASPPTIGLQVGIISATANADVNEFDNLMITGNYSLTSFYNRSSEDTLYVHPVIWNYWPGGSAYTVIMDGYNHFAVTSLFQTVTDPVDVFTSFQSNTFLDPDFRRTGPGAAVWAGGTAHHQYIGGYIGNSGTTGVTSYGFIVYGTNSMLNVDIHGEAYPYLTDMFYFTAPTGQTSISADGLSFRDNLYEGSNSVLKMDPALTGGVSLTNAHIEVSGFLHASKVFDNPALWTVSGSYEFPAAFSSWNLPAAQFSGIGTIGQAVSYYGNGQNVTLPSPLVVSAVTNTSGVAAINVTGTGTYILASGQASPNLPNPIIAAPPSGQTATGITNYVRWVGSNNEAGSIINVVSSSGTCANGNVLSLSGGTLASGVANNTAQVTVTSVSGSNAVTATQLHGGAYTAISPITGTYPSDSTTFTNGTCTVALSENVWGVYNSAASVTVVPGSGYSVAPAVTWQTAGQQVAPTATASLTPVSLAFSAGGGNLTLSAAGETLGLVGGSGLPVIHASSTEDATIATSTPSTGTSITAAANTDAYYIAGSTSLSTLTFLLPPLTGDKGQRFDIHITPSITTLVVQTSTGGSVTTTSSAATTGNPLTRSWTVLTASGAWTQTQ
jgi:hypothetical protein